jgi:type II secretory pathway pseudopilin PulG
MQRARGTEKLVRAFTLLELIGVLTVLAILAGLLIPTVFNAIHNAAINQTASSLNSLRTACAGHYAKFGCFATDGSAAPPATILLDGSDPRSSQFDKVLIWEQLLESLFSPKIGDGLLGSTNTRVQIVAGLPPGIPADVSNAAYSFDGNGLNQASGTVVVEAIITGVPLLDAKALNDLIDGPSLGENSSGNDLLGRVKYGAPGNSNGSGSGNSGGNSGNGGGNGNGNGLGNGNGNGGHNNGNGNGGSDNGNGNGGNGNGNGNSGGSGNGSSNPSQSGNTVTVHVYLTHH